MDRHSPLLAIVVPCFNEEEVLPETIKQLTGVLTELIVKQYIRKESKIIFVDDGSFDKTWPIIVKESIKNAHVSGIKLAKNAGHQKALLAGLRKATGKYDCVISIDADLQDDISVILDFIKKFREGYDIVYGVRENRDSDSFFKRRTAEWFYRLTNRLGIPLVPNHGDFRLLSKRALHELSRYGENNLFLRGIVPLLGFPSAKIYYDRKRRMAGETKYPLKKMLSFALDGITSFTVVPIRAITFLGFLLFFLSMAAAGYAFFQKRAGHTIPGWTSLMISIWFLGGLQLAAIGVIGEYIGKIYTEVKSRPKYAIEIDLLENPILSNERKELIFFRENARTKEDSS